MGALRNLQSLLPRRSFFSPPHSSLLLLSSSTATSFSTTSMQQEKPCLRRERSSPPRVRNSSYTSRQLQQHILVTSRIFYAFCIISWVACLVYGQHRLWWSIGLVASHSIPSRSLEHVSLTQSSVPLDATTATTSTGDTATESRMTWQNDLNVVHVIETRFMQLQPRLLHLGRARLDMFQSFTLPSILAQTNQQFIWIIRTDPDLDLSLKTELLALLSPYPHIMLVASNDNPEDFRSSSITTLPVWSGSTNLLQSYHQAAQTHVVLQTRLDADDALHVNVIQTLQQEASKHLVPVSNSAEWRIWCMKIHAEWQFYSPFDEQDVHGALWGLHSQFCITPGLTHAYALGAHSQLIPGGPRHDRIHAHVHQCKKALKGDHNDCLSLMDLGSARSDTHFGRHGQRCTTSSNFTSHDAMETFPTGSVGSLSAHVWL
jgi:hypothetical protein